MSFTVRKTFLLIVILSLGALGIALVSQHWAGMRPCAWCVLQRFVLLLLAVVALLGAAAGSRVAVAVLSGLGLAVSVSGITAAWYQYSVAAQQFSCSQTFADRFMTGLGLDSALPWLFGIYATCMDARVNLFGVEYALWGLVLFVLITGLNLFVLVRALQGQGSSHARD